MSLLLTVAQSSVRIICTNYMTFHHGERPAKYHKNGTAPLGYAALPFQPLLLKLIFCP